jgi:prevent-host-death family protein
MIHVGIKEVKNNLSRLLERVKNGEEIVITDRRRPVARIVNEQQGAVSIRESLGPLVQKGLIVLPSRGITRKNKPPVEADGMPVSEMVREGRR